MGCGSHGWLAAAVRVADLGRPVVRPPCEMAGAVFMAASRLVRLAAVAMADIATVARQWKHEQSVLKYAPFSQRLGHCFKNNDQNNEQHIADFGKDSPMIDYGRLTAEQFKALTGAPADTLVISRLPWKRPAASPSNSAAPPSNGSTSGRPASSNGSKIPNPGDAS